MIALSPPAPTGIWGREAMAEMKRSLRQPQFLLPTMFAPAVFFGLSALALAKSPAPSQAIAMLAGYGVFAATGPALFGFGAGVAAEREQGLIELKRVSPMPPSAYVFAKLAAAIAATAVSLAAIDVLAIFAGVTMSGDKWLGLAALHLIAAIPFALIGFGIGMRMSGKGAVAVANALFLACSALGGLWFPRDMLPAWIRLAGEVTPSFHLGQLARFMAGLPTSGAPLDHLVALIAITSLAAAWAWTGWRRSPA